MQRKFTTRVDATLLRSLRKRAHEEERTLQGLVEEALVDLLKKRHAKKPRDSVMDVYHSSLDRFELLYKMLAAAETPLPAATGRAMKEARRGKLKAFKGVDDLMAELNAKD